MARFPQACGKTSRGPLVILKRQNKGRVRSWERQREEAGERQNKEPRSNLQNFDFLTHHSHPWDHGKISQVSWGQLPMAWANYWLNLGTLAKVTSSGLCLMTDYSKRNLLWIHTMHLEIFQNTPSSFKPLGHTTPSSPSWCHSKRDLLMWLHLGILGFAYSCKNSCRFYVNVACSKGERVPAVPRDFLCESSNH